MASHEQQIFQQAANRHGIEPRVLWGVYGTESGFGKNASTSSAGAEGPLQFEPGTARSLGVKNVNNLAEAADGAARYLAQFKGRGLAGMLSAYNAGPAGGLQPEYVKKVLANAKSWNGAGLMPSGGPGQALMGQLGVSPSSGAGEPDNSAMAAIVAQLAGSKPAGPVATPLQAPEASAVPPLPEGFKLPAPEQVAPKQGGSALLTALSALGQGGGASSPSVAAGGAVGGSAGTPNAAGYVNPLGKGFSLGRVDQGVDASAAPGTPIRAIGNAKVLGIQPNWYKGQPYVYYQLLDGPQKGKVVYVAEQISPTVRPGQTVRAGQPIGTYASSGTGIETGFGTPSGSTLARSTSGYSEGQQTPAGQQFRRFLGQLGAR